MPILLVLFNLSLLFSCGITVAADAQVNIETQRGRPGVSGGFQIHYGGATGNSEFFDGGATANITYNAGHYTLLLLGRGLLGFASGERFSNQGLSHVRFTWTRDARFQPELFGQLDYARPRKLVNRALVGTGVRTVIRNSENFALSVGNGLMWERENLDLLPFSRHDDLTSVIRSTNYLNLQVDSRAAFRLTGYCQINVTDITDTRVIADLEVTSALIGPLEQTTSLRYRLDSDQPDGVERNDVHVGTSLGLKF